MLSNCSHQPALLVTVTLVAGLVKPVVTSVIPAGSALLTLSPASVDIVIVVARPPAPERLTSTLGVVKLKLLLVICCSRKR